MIRFAAPRRYLFAFAAGTLLSCGRLAGEAGPDLSRGGTVRVGTVQFHSIADTLPPNEAKAEALIRQAAARGALCARAARGPRGVQSKTTRVPRAR